MRICELIKKVDWYKTVNLDFQLCAHQQSKHRRPNVTLLIPLILLIVVGCAKSREASIILPRHSVQEAYFLRLLEENAVPYEIVNGEYRTEGRENRDMMFLLSIEAQGPDADPVHFYMQSGCESKSLIDFLTNREIVHESRTEEQRVRFIVLMKDYTSFDMVKLKYDIMMECADKPPQLDFVLV